MVRWGLCQSPPTSQFDQPELPKAEVRRFNDPDGDYIFIRNLHETRRMLYSL